MENTLICHFFTETFSFTSLKYNNINTKKKLLQKRTILAEKKACWML